MMRVPRVTATKRQRGFLAVLSLPLLSLMLLVTIALAGLVFQLQRSWYLQNTADNLAYSGAILMARELNLHALFNRAILTNQLLLGQLTGLSSYLSMFALAATNAALAASWVPYLNAAMRFAAQVLERSEPVAQGLIKIGITTQTTILNLLQTTQALLPVLTMQQLPKTLAELAEQHQLDESAWEIFHAPGLVKFPWLWWRVTQRRTPRNDDGMLYALQEDSRDQFLRARTYNWFDAGLIKVKKAGGTELVENSIGQWHWQSLDTLAIHLRVLWWQIELPWAQGARTAGQRVHSVSADKFGRSARLNPRTTQWARAQQRRLGRASRPSYFALSEPQNTTHMAIIVRVGTAVAKASPYFVRAEDLWPRADQRIERSNLFNPLWLAQLQPLNLSDRSVLSRFKFEWPQL